MGADGIRCFERGGRPAVPDTVTAIEDFAFSGCTSLRSVTIPDSVISIGHCAFAGCTSLGSVSCPRPWSMSAEARMRRGLHECAGSPFSMPPKAACGLCPQYAGESLSEIRKLRAVSRP